MCYDDKTSDIPLNNREIYKDQTARRRKKGNRRQEGRKDQERNGNENGNRNK